VESRAERVGKNEALFREVNERIREITTYDSDVEFLCECGDPACARPIVMTLAEYEEVRTDPKRFVVVPGHEIRDVETTLATNERFSIVEKHPGTPTELAVETDPRA
jgi:hypothetical protein